MSSRCFLQLKDGEQLYARSFPGYSACTASANCAASSRSGVEVSHQRRSAYGAYASARAIGASIPGWMRKKPSGRPLPGQELAVALVDVAREERCGECVGARDEDSRHVEDVGGEPRGDERADEVARRDEHLPAQVAALLLGGQLVLEMHAGGPGLDEGLHQLERVERTAEAGLGVREHGSEPVRPVPAFGGVDLVGAEQRVVDALDERGGAVHGIEALVGIRVRREVPVRRDLPAGEVDGLQPRLHHLHGLGAGECAERGHVRLVVHQLPQPLRPEARDRVLHTEATLQPLDVLLRIGPLDAGPASRSVRLRPAHRPLLP